MTAVRLMARILSPALYLAGVAVNEVAELFPVPVVR